MWLVETSSRASALDLVVPRPSGRSTDASAYLQIARCRLRRIERKYPEEVERTEEVRESRRRPEEHNEKQSDSKQTCNKAGQAICSVSPTGLDVN